MANIQFSLNGTSISVDCDLSERLLDFLRSKSGKTGVKEGCGEGECGACAVLMNGKIVNSCMVPLANVAYKDIVTIEGFAKTERFKILERAFSETGGVQCGFCTPGMIIASESLLNINPHPSDEVIKIGLSGNLCRCTGYNMIIDAVKLAAKLGDGLW